jgi:hypothetical protein
MLTRVNNGTTTGVLSMTLLSIIYYNFGYGHYDLRAVVLSLQIY